MLWVVEIEPGVVEFNWSWAPTWIGMNSKLKQDMEKDLGPSLKGKTMNEASNIVLTYLCKKFKVEGLRDYLDGIKFIQEQ